MTISGRKRLSLERLLAMCAYQHFVCGGGGRALDHHHHLHLPDLYQSNFEPLTIAGFLALLSFSFIASMHCATMCAPLVSAKLGGHAKLKSKSIWIYNAGRGISYITAGAALGALHWQTVDWFPGLGSWLSRVLGVAIIVASFMTLLDGEGVKLPPALSRFTMSTGKTIANITRKFTRHQQDFVLGLVTVFLPCMTLAPALAASAATASWLGGGILMAAFFLGTVPVMVMAPLAPGSISKVFPRAVVRVLTFVFLLLVGVLTLARGGA